jgi:hypothetical protein
MRRVSRLAAFSFMANVLGRKVRMRNPRLRLYASGENGPCKLRVLTNVLRAKPNPTRPRQRIWSFASCAKRGEAIWFVPHLQ